MNKSSLKIFIGNKIDLRTNSSITSGEARNTLLKQIGKSLYYECSALTQDGLKNLFDSVLKEIMAEKSKTLKLSKLSDKK